MNQQSLTYILTASCPGRSGTVDVVTRFLREFGCYISELNSFDDALNQRFFIRTVFRMEDNASLDQPVFCATFAERAEEFDMEWELTPSDYRPKVVIMVSKYEHCLNDLLYRFRTGNLPVDIRAVISNHPDLQSLAEWHDIPYYHFPITADTKPQQEAQVQAVLAETGCELLVLARYMQVLSHEMCVRWARKAINIHHSLLPGFKGAKPYHQAYNKGVKLVGATAHYVSDFLDEGPIITQGMETVNHTYYPADLARKGMDVESLTLTRAIQYHIEKRIFLFNDKTVVFERS
ncbi:formyltetrahydrofolate deformylase [Photobacterium profundum]|uniref:Formyltetrahydrofolate deformylase n=1 Tax=Photobacterium profundum 3TCK TaxID=314280 RepID=Q1Z9K8_9GAMM|nr:formyltetrahydrofolate deformylase [Photobacterium profundum]EAS45834.1 formyltetrahydrofolate deformylase [Photobacterium profundum 3TCK]PSV63042.1 formyltetrahydrofolate deformylase [Photobacterium profundum]